MAPMLTRQQRLHGGLVGLLVGDALGVPYEFHACEDIPAPEQIEMQPPPGFQRAHAGVPAGTWSDDGAHALCLLASLRHCDRLDPEDLMRRLTNWYEHGYMAVDAVVFDIGIQTGVALREFAAGTTALACGPAGEHDNGNGSLMRVLPLALWHRGSDEALIADAGTQSRITHGHARTQVCCALYCMWARRILEDHRSPWTSAVAAVRAHCRPDSPEQEALEFHIRPDDEARGQGSGYVVDCLRSASMVQRESSYEAVVRAAIGLGQDTDTTACVAGGIAGLRWGVDAIPLRWREQLRGATLYQPLLDALLRA
jgi:ADP-ribosyl-[dinitrogen reductase] hydrolase